MSQRLPGAAYALGGAGLLPMLLSGVAAASSGPGRVLGMAALLGYAAVILSFLGAVHWGLAIAAPVVDGEAGAAPSASRRLALSTVPALTGWVALVLMALSLPDPGLALLTAGFVATAVTEAYWSRAGLLPPGYMTLRLLLTIAVVAILLLVLAVRLLGITFLL